MNGTEFIAHILKQEGVNEMTCFPSNALIEEAAKKGIRPVMFRHERGAIMAADGYSRMSDGKKFGVVAMQHAGGAENSVGGLSQALETTCLYWFFQADIHWNAETSDQTFLRTKTGKVL